MFYYRYHSHFGLQRSDGLSGALIVLPRPPTNQTTDGGKFQPDFLSFLLHFFPPVNHDSDENSAADKQFLKRSLKTYISVFSNSYGAIN